MSSREDLKRFQALDMDFSSIGLEQSENVPYFCTPVGAEYVGWIGCDGVHFILLPEDERVFCVEPSMGEEGTYVLPVAADFREFLSFVLFCKDANPLSQIFWLSKERFREFQAEDGEARWDGCEEFFARKTAALDAIVKAFSLEPKDPYEKVKALQAAFDPSCLTFSDAYYDVLGLENPHHTGREEKKPPYTLFTTLRMKIKENDS